MTPPGQEADEGAPPADIPDGADLNGDDLALIASARKLIEARYVENRHHIAAALLSASGRIYHGLHLDTYVGRASVCAEAVAIGQALSAGETSILAIVSLRHPRPSEAHREPQVVAPCGICRELLCDFAPDAAIIVPTPAGPRKVAATKLLPVKYRRKP